MTVEEALRLAEWLGHTMRPFDHLPGWDCECAALMWAHGGKPRGTAITLSHDACVERQRRNAYERDRWLRKYDGPFAVWPGLPKGGVE